MTTRTMVIHSSTLDRIKKAVKYELDTMRPGTMVTRTRIERDDTGYKATIQYMESDDE